MTPPPVEATNAFILLGIVARPHGLRGELKVRPFTERPGNFSSYRRLYLSADGEEPRVLYTNCQARVSGNAVILKLEECATREQAEQLAGMQIWLASCDLPPLDGEEFYLFTLEGKRAQTEDGRVIGTVMEILSSHGQDILVIRDGQAEYLVPVVRKFVVAIDDDKVVLDLPPGLLEINS